MPCHPTILPRGNHQDGRHRPRRVTALPVPPVTEAVPHDRGAMPLPHAGGRSGDTAPQGTCGCLAPGGAQVSPGTGAPELGSGAGAGGEGIPEDVPSCWNAELCPTCAPGQMLKLPQSRRCIHAPRAVRSLCLQPALALLSSSELSLTASLALCFCFRRSFPMRMFELVYLFQLKNSTNPSKMLIRSISCS